MKRKIAIIMTVFALVNIYIYANTCTHMCDCGRAYRDSDTTCPGFVGSASHEARCKHDGEEIYCQQCSAGSHGLFPHVYDREHRKCTAPPECHSYVEEEESND